MSLYIIFVHIVWLIQCNADAYIYVVYLQGVTLQYNGIDTIMFFTLNNFKIDC